MRDSNYVPDSMEDELEIRCNAGNALFNDLWAVIQRHLLESYVTKWEIVGALYVARQVFSEKYMQEFVPLISEEETED